jgi:hypothetical protein
MKMKRMAESGFGLWKIVTLTIAVVNNYQLMKRFENYFIGGAR